MSSPLNPDTALRGFDKLQALQSKLNTTLIGQEHVVNDTLITLLAAGHVLIEGVPGLGKTFLVRVLSVCLNADFTRIQFTPDLMPTDVTGHGIFDMKSGEFKIRRGPVFTHFLLADEINRAPAKTQAALLEIMQEQQITIEGTSYAAKSPFMVLATQNPVEQEGTYPLPEAELDRFMMKVLIDFPDQASEIQLVDQATSGITHDGQRLETITPIMTTEDILALQSQVTDIHIDHSIMAYAVDIVRATRAWPGIRMGAGPRAGISLIRCARAAALLQQRQFVLPDDVKSVACAVLRHRLQLSAEMEIEGANCDSMVHQILQQVPTPDQ